MGPRRWRGGRSRRVGPDAGRGRYVTEVRLVAEAADASARPWPQRDSALGRGHDEAGQDRRDFCERARRGRVVGGLELAAGPSKRPTRARTAARTCATSSSLGGGAG